MLHNSGDCVYSISSLGVLILVNCIWNTYKPFFTAHLFYVFIQTVILEANCYTGQGLFWRACQCWVFMCHDAKEQQLLLSHQNRCTGCLCRTLTKRNTVGLFEWISELLLTRLMKSIVFCLQSLQFQVKVVFQNVLISEIPHLYRKWILEKSLFNIEHDWVYLQHLQEAGWVVLFTVFQIMVTSSSAACNAVQWPDSTGFWCYIGCIWPDS